MSSLSQRSALPDDIWAGEKSPKRETVVCGPCIIRAVQDYKPVSPPVVPGKSKLRSMVRHQCANYKAGDDCPLWLNGCKVTRGRRCEYFERAVLPVAKMNPKDFSAAARSYAAQTQAMGFRGKTKGRRCKQCKARIPPRKQYCSECAMRRKRESNRLWKRRRDGGGKNEVSQ